MQYNNFELFNVVDVEKTENGVILKRFPGEVINNLTLPLFDKDGNKTEDWTRHRYYAKKLSGVEIRFYSKATEVELSLFSEEGGIISIYNGDWFLEDHYMREGETLNITVKRNPFVNGIPKKNCNRFNVNVWRICYAGSPLALRKVLPNAKWRLPKPTELPKKTILAYGSSITYGGGTPYTFLNYIGVAANILGVDIKNKGICGGCQSDEGIREYLLTEEFDYGYFELCTNIAERPLWLIEERMGKLIDDICTKFPNKKMFFVTPFMCFGDMSKSSPDYNEEFAKPYKVLTEHVKKHANAILIDGHKLLPKAYYFNADLEHPSDFGHVMQGTILAKLLKKHLK